MSRYIYMLSVSTMAVSGCKKPYAPSVVAANSNYLVVEGVINSGPDSTIITLSRTVNVSGTTTANPETGARVFVQSDQNTSYSLTETKAGRYAAPSLGLDNSRKYQLKITTANNKVYQSDLEAAQTTPPIDSLYYTTDSNGLSLYSNAHDPSNNTQYYRWDYVETYVYQSGMETYYKFDQATQNVVFRTPAEQVYICYDTDSSTNIILNSTAKLSQDIITGNPIARIPASSEKLFHRYSILLKQYAMTKEAYDFWTILKTNTENLGGIFDAQPSQLKGNIHCITTPSEPVIGYVSVCSVSQKRIFIDNSQLPAWLYNIPQACDEFVVHWYYGQTPPSELIGGIEIPVLPSTTSFDSLHNTNVISVKVGYYDCLDCTYHNHGVNIEPDFWK